MTSSSSEKWFGPRLYGYGVTPINGKGWAVFGAYLLCILALTFETIVASMSGTPHPIITLVLMGLATAVFLMVAVKKGPASWRASR